jgi:hypothetical protein
MVSISDAEKIFLDVYQGKKADFYVRRIGIERLIAIFQSTPLVNRLF